jgi:hypothetical protein
MRPSSAKQKGRLHQQWVAKKLLEHAPELEGDDCRSTSMGAGGEDLKLSPAARKVYPVQIECKSKAAYSVYTDYVQAASHGTHEPLLVIKANHKKPLAVVDAEWFIKLMAENYHYRKDKE